MANAANFDAARKIVRQHYQSIVLHDMLPRLVERDVHDHVVVNGRTWWMPEGVYKKSELCMPVEFSVAAYRLGHSMVRNSCEWNRVFETGGSVDIASLGQLFQFAGHRGNLGGAPTLPASWIIDWTRFHDFSDITGVSNHGQSNKTRPIDTAPALGLADLPEFQNETPPIEALLRNLAVRYLPRGSQVGLLPG